MIPHIQRRKNSLRRHKRREKEKAEKREEGATEIPRAERRLQHMDTIYGVGQGPAKLRSRWMDRLQRFWNSQTT